MDNIEIITTADGSHSLLNKQLQETYHSQHGALQESLHVFVRHGLEFFVEATEASNPVRIFEVGFGTGLNALLTCSWVRDKNYSIEYSSIESYPLQEDVWKNLNYAHSPDEQKIFHELHACKWNEIVVVQERFKLLKLSTTLQDIKLENRTYDVVYFDAFAPNKQPEMWELPMLEKVVHAMSDRGIFVTYCAKGQLKRDLRSLGLQVETLPGPPGKKEMVRATRST
jgi:tRNA U34 5-methylaminomethyl-2-thiouridine-forming methyltransferase MnmC